MVARYPGTPAPKEPERNDAPGVPAWLEERMFGERIVLLQGPITAESASRAAAAMLTLDSLGTGPVTLQISANDGDLTAAFALIDTIELMRVPVHAMASGEVAGAAIGVLVSARKRLAFPHARFRLSEPRVAGVSGTASEVAGAAGRYLQSLEELVVRVAEVTGRPRSRVEDDFAASRVLTAMEAKEYGLVESVVSAAR
jgi:ATP-dependent Clp protease protease subunit